jgi:hypothetical protein
VEAGNLLVTRELLGSMRDQQLKAVKPVRHKLSQVNL